MPRTFTSPDLFEKESTGNQPTSAIAAWLEEEKEGAMQLVPLKWLIKASFNGCLSVAARHSELDDQQIAERIFISTGYMSKFMRGVGQQWARRLVSFMRVTNSLAPLQWLAEQMGCDIVPRSAQMARIRELEAEMERLKGGKS